MSPIVIDNYASISDRFRDLLKNHNYENIVYAVIEKSKKIFGNMNFKKILDQSNGQCDFEDNYGNKYDAKLIIDTKQGALLGERKNSLNLWFDDLISECNEFTVDCIDEDGNQLLRKTKLFKIVKDRVESLKEDENGLLFIPFPIVSDTAHMIFSQFSTDFIQAIYNTLKDDGIIKNRKIYFIYPGMGMNEIVLRDGNYHREYLNVKELGDYIAFISTSMIEEDLSL